MVGGRFFGGLSAPFRGFLKKLPKIPKNKKPKETQDTCYTLTVLLVMVFLLPAFLVNDVGMGDPFFCKYLCPQGVLEGAIPLSLANAGIRAALGKLFTWKFSILLSVIVLSVLFYRPLCKWLCPLGAFYALFNRVSLFQMKVDKNKCISCGKCARACKMDVDVTKRPTIPSASAAECASALVRRKQCASVTASAAGKKQQRKQRWRNQNEHEENFCTGFCRADGAGPGGLRHRRTMTRWATWSGNGSAMTGEPKTAEEALALHKELLERENALLSENTELWGKGLYGGRQGHGHDRGRKKLRRLPVGYRRGR